MTFERGQCLIADNGAEAMLVGIQNRLSPDKPYSVVFSHPEWYGIRGYHHLLSHDRMVELFGGGS